MQVNLRRGFAENAQIYGSPPDPDVRIFRRAFPFALFSKNFEFSTVKGMVFFHAKHAKEIPRRGRKEEKCISHRFTDFLKPARLPFA
jgi:hypothetical protein